MIVAGLLVGTSLINNIQAQQGNDPYLEARLEYCYRLLDDISNDFGWFWQQQKRTLYNENCGELLGYIDPNIQ
jgi:hypothetical protein